LRKLSSHRDERGKQEDEMWWYYGQDAYYEQVLEHELGYLRRSGDTRRDSLGEHHAAAETPIPLWWVSAWIGGLAVISLGLGLASQWLSH
jgi:hypothetical protein